MRIGGIGYGGFCRLILEYKWSFVLAFLKGKGNKKRNNNGEREQKRERKD